MEKQGKYLAMSAAQGIKAQGGGAGGEGDNKRRETK